MYRRGNYGAKQICALEKSKAVADLVDTKLRRLERLPHLMIELVAEFQRYKKEQAIIVSALQQKLDAVTRPTSEFTSFEAPSDIHTDDTEQPHNEQGHNEQSHTEYAELVPAVLNAAKLEALNNVQSSLDSMSDGVVVDYQQQTPTDDSKLNTPSEFAGYQSVENDAVTKIPETETAKDSVEPTQQEHHNEPVHNDEPTQQEHHNEPVHNEPTRHEHHIDEPTQEEHHNEKPEESEETEKPKKEPFSSPFVQIKKKKPKKTKKSKKKKDSESDTE